MRSIIVLQGHTDLTLAPPGATVMGVFMYANNGSTLSVHVRPTTTGTSGLGGAAGTIAYTGGTITIDDTFEGFGPEGVQEQDSTISANNGGDINFTMNGGAIVGPNNIGRCEFDTYGDSTSVANITIKKCGRSALVGLYGGGILDLTETATTFLWGTRLYIEIL
jgi:hypothetical protein